MVDGFLPGTWCKGYSNPYTCLKHGVASQDYLKKTVLKHQRYLIFATSIQCQKPELNTENATTEEGSNR